MPYAACPLCGGTYVRATSSPVSRMAERYYTGRVGIPRALRRRCSWPPAAAALPLEWRGRVPAARQRSLRNMLSTRIAPHLPGAHAAQAQAVRRWAQGSLRWWHRPPAGHRTVAPDSADPVRLIVQDYVATVTLDRPARRNALNLACWRALADIAAHLAKD